MLLGKLFIVALLFVILNFGSVRLQLTNRKNACKSFHSYFYADISSNCYHNPDIYLSAPEIILRHTGKVENYTITTEDGYILTSFRIPQENPKGVVIVQPPLGGDVATWVTTNDGSLPFLLHKAGYDVWLPNSRGTPYSMGHTNLSPKSAEYWDFSYHELGIYDYPAIIEFVKNKTNEKVFYIGQGQSSTGSYVYASLKPEEAKNNVKLFVTLAPITYFKHVLWFLKPIFKIVYGLNQLAQFLGSYAILYPSELFRPFAKFLTLLPIQSLVNYGTCIIFGWSPGETDPQLVNALITGLKPIPRKIAQHYLQTIINDGIFRKYDHGKKKNKELYNAEIPPEYPIDKITTPFYMMVGQKDTTTRDSHILYQKLPKQVKKYGQKILPGVNDLQFFYGKHTVENIYKPIIDLIDKVNGESE